MGNARVVEHGASYFDEYIPNGEQTIIIMKANIQLIVAALLALAGIALLFVGMIYAPKGEIHESVLVGFGEVATFAGSLMGIDYKYRYNHDNPTDSTKEKR